MYKNTNEYKKWFSRQWERTTRPFKPVDKNYIVRRDSHSQSVVKGGNKKHACKKKQNNIIIQ